MRKHLFEMTDAEIEQMVDEVFDNLSVEETMNMLEDIGMFHDFDREEIRQNLEQNHVKKVLGKRILGTDSFSDETRVGAWSGSATNEINMIL